MNHQIYFATCCQSSTYCYIFEELWPNLIVCEGGNCNIASVYISGRIWLYKVAHVYWLPSGLIPSALFMRAQETLNTSLELTHLPLDKMAAILADDNVKCIFFNENDTILIWISLKFVPRCPIDNIPALVQVMAWHQTIDKPLHDPMLIEFTDPYGRL